MPEPTASQTPSLPFAMREGGGVPCRLTLAEHEIEGLLRLDRLELEVPGETEVDAPIERYQRRRTRLRLAALRIDQEAVDRRIAQVAPDLAPTGITQLAATLAEGHVAVSCRLVDGLAAADVTFKVHVVAAGATLRVTAGSVRVHGYVPTPSPLIADRILAAALGAGDPPPATNGGREDGRVRRPWTRGLCDVEIDVLDAVMWRLLPPSGWRLPATTGVELVAARTTPAAIVLAYAPVGDRSERRPDLPGPLGIDSEQVAQQLAAAHDAMRTADELLRKGQLDDAMRGYRALLAAGGPDQPVLLERLLAVTAARPTWFLDGVELARQALARWPEFLPARAALASIALARGDTREAARHLQTLAELAGADQDHAAAALAALAAARLQRVIDPRGATRLYELALTHRPGSNEAIDGLAERYADERRWSDLAKLLRERATIADRGRAAALQLQLADLYAGQLDDRDAARAAVLQAATLAPADLGVLQAVAATLTRLDDVGAEAAWRAVIAIADDRADAAASADGWAALATLASVAEPERVRAWQAAVALVPHHARAQLGLAGRAAALGDHAGAVAGFEIALAGALPAAEAARAEIARAESLIALGQRDAAEAALRRAAAAKGEVGALAHGLLAQLSLADLESSGRSGTVAPATSDQAVDTAIEALTEIADGLFPAGDNRSTESLVAAADEAFAGDGARLYARAAELAIARAGVREQSGDRAGAAADLERAHDLAATHAPSLARRAARALLDHGGDPHVERRWIDAVLATRPPPDERAPLLIRRAALRTTEPSPDPGASIADLHEALALPASDDLRRKAYDLEAAILAGTGDRRARAQALAARARLADSPHDTAATEAEAAAAWLAADEPATALPHGARAMRAMDDAEVDVAPDARRRVLTTLGEAAWRQRAFADVTVAYRALLVDDDVAPDERATFRFRLAVSLDRSGRAGDAVTTLEQVNADPSAPPDIRAQALRLAAELTERLGDLAAAATALERFAHLADAGISDGARADALYRAGELHRRRQSSDDAARCLEAALDVVEHHLPALDALELVERTRGNFERVAVILGRKIAASARHPGRQKALLLRLAELWIELAKPGLARAAHERALELDPDFRPALRYLAASELERGALAEAAPRYLKLATRLPDDAGGDEAALGRQRIAALQQLNLIIGGLPPAQRTALEPELVRLGNDLASVAAHRSGSARITGDDDDERTPGPVRPDDADATAIGLRAAAAVARTEGAHAQALADLEAANMVAPGNPDVLRELVDVSRELGDHKAAGTYLEALAASLDRPARTTRRAEVLLELADLCYDYIGDRTRARAAMRAAADGFGGARRDATLRMLAAEASSQRDWDDAVRAYQAIEPARRSAADLVQLGTVLHRAGRGGEAIELLDAEVAEGRLDEEGELLRLTLVTERSHKSERALALEHRAALAPVEEARARLVEALHLYRDVLGDEAAAVRVEVALGVVVAGGAEPLPPTPTAEMKVPTPNVDVDVDVDVDDQGGLAEIVNVNVAVNVNGGSSGNGSAHSPEARFSAQLAEHRSRGNARAFLEEFLWEAKDRLRARAMLELAIDYRDVDGDALRSAVLLQSAHDADPELTAIWQPLASALAASDDLAGAAALYDRIAECPDFDEATRTWASAQAEMLGGGGVVTRGEMRAHAKTRDMPTTARADSVTLELPAVPDPPDPVDDSRVTIDMQPEEVERRITDRMSAADMPNEVRITDQMAAAMPPAADPPAPATPPVAPPVTSHRPRRTDRLFSQKPKPPARRSSEMDAQIAVAAAAAAEAQPVPLIDPDAPPPPPPVPRTPGPRASTPPPFASASELAKAQDLAARGQLSAAIARAENASAVAPTGDMSALQLLETLYSRAGDVDAQTEVIGRQIVVTPDPVTRAALWRRRAKLYRELPRRDAEVYRCLKEAHACAPDDPTLAHELRVMAMARGDWGLCAQLLYREIAAAPTDRERGALHLELGLVFDDRLGDVNQARANYEQALALDRTIPAATLRLARLYETDGKFDEAAQLFDDAARTAPADRKGVLRDRAAAARSRGSTAKDDTPVLVLEPDPTVQQLERDLAAAWATGDTMTAFRRAERLWARLPGHREAFEVLAAPARAKDDLRILGALVGARAAAIPDGRARSELWFDLGQRWLARGDLTEAARALDRALIDDAEHGGALASRAELAFRAEDWTTADVLYAHLGPHHSKLPVDDLLLRRSEIAERLGRHRDALGLAQAAARLVPPRLEAALRVGALAAALGENAIATAAAAAALTLIPSNDPAQLAAGRLVIADLQKKGGDPGAAISQLEQVLTDDPLNPVALDGLVELYRAAGDPARGVRHLRTLIAHTERPELRARRLLQLGVLHTDLGELAAADDAFLRSSDLDPGEVATMRHLLDTYWRGGELDHMVEVATELAQRDALLDGQTPPATLARTAIAVAAAAALHLARRIVASLPDPAKLLARALAELATPRGDLDINAGVAALDDMLSRLSTPTRDQVISAAQSLPGGAGADAAAALRAL